MLFDDCGCFGVSESCGVALESRQFGNGDCGRVRKGGSRNGIRRAGVIVLCVPVEVRQVGGTMEEER